MTGAAFLLLTLALVVAAADWMAVHRANKPLEYVCKPLTLLLLMGAAAQKYKMFLCVQDLSCPGYSFLHSASLAARIPTIAAIEGNSRQ